tara:strand:- start:783 stop:1160 length:378 start_codon:yes stop_codon:yes gene_type:complete
MEQEEERLTNEERMLVINRLHELLRPFMLRRIKSEVLDQLPDKVEKVLKCDLSAWQKTIYRQIQASAMGRGEKAGQMVRGLNNVMMQLRKGERAKQAIFEEDSRILENTRDESREIATDIHSLLN